MPNVCHRPAPTAMPGGFWLRLLHRLGCAVRVPLVLLVPLALERQQQPMGEGHGQTPGHPGDPPGDDVGESVVPEEDPAESHRHGIHGQGGDDGCTGSSVFHVQDHQI